MSGGEVWAAFAALIGCQAVAGRRGDIDVPWSGVPALAGRSWATRRAEAFLAHSLDPRHARGERRAEAIVLNDLELPALGRCLGVRDSRGGTLGGVLWAVAEALDVAADERRPFAAR